MKSIIAVFLLTLFLNVSLSGQNKDSLEFEGLKQFLPYVLKNISKEKPMELEESTSGLFFKPWEVDRLSDAEVNDVLEKLVANKRFSVEKDYRGDLKLEFFSKLQDFPTIEEIQKSNGLLSNSFIDVSDIDIADENGNSIYIDGEKKNVRYNESKELTFNMGQVSTSFPIREDYSQINGSIRITIKEYTDIQFREFQKGAQNVSFDLGETKNIKLQKIAKNRAFFVVPANAGEVDIISTNKEGHKFTMHTKSTLPLKVYEFAMKPGITDEEIDSFIEELTYEDVLNTGNIIIYETNGSIENLYIYQKSKPHELGSKELEIHL